MPNEPQERNQIDEHRFKFAFDVVKFYEEAAARVKTRTWSISAWVYSVNSALLAFCFTLSPETGSLFGVVYSVVGACLAGIALSIALIVLVQNQGEHLEGYMIIQKNATEADTTLGRMIDIGTPTFPGFCKHLITITRLYIAGFVITVGWAIARSLLCT